MSDERVTPESLARQVYERGEPITVEQLHALHDPPVRSALIEERLAERVLATSSLDPNDGDTESADPADWIIAAVRRALARQEDALTALVEHAQCERETMRAERDAWWEFARHQQFCSVCAESVESCEHGAHLMHAAEALLSSLPVESSSRGSADLTATAAAPGAADSNQVHGDTA